MHDGDVCLQITCASYTTPLHMVSVSVNYSHTMVQSCTVVVLCTHKGYLYLYSIGDMELMPTGTNDGESVHPP